MCGKWTRTSLDRLIRAKTPIRRIRRRLDWLFPGTARGSSREAETGQSSVSFQSICRVGRARELKPLVWDVRSIRRPVAVAEGFETRYPDTNIIFSPDGRSILTGVPPAQKGEKGAVVLLDSDTLKEQRRVPIGDGTVIKVLWHSRINQVRADDELKKLGCGQRNTERPR
jgi:hypothetical protein